jgi:hypothetical protein
MELGNLAEVLLHPANSAKPRRHRRRDPIP